MNCLAIALVASLVAAAAMPAVAQNASQISRVRGGASCPGCNLFQGDFSGLEVRGLNLAGARLRQADLSLTVNTSNDVIHTGAPQLSEGARVVLHAKPEFYPADLPSKKFLQYYATRLNSTEVNYTFMRLPAAKSLAEWVDNTPAGFVFSLPAGSPPELDLLSMETNDA